MAARPFLPPTNQGWVAFFGHFVRQPVWAALIGLVNLVGIVYGFWYYSAQFASTPWYWWPLVPDSPLAVMWAELALIAFWLKRESPVLNALAFIGNVQVGLWTVYVLLAYAPEFGTYKLNLNTILLAGHAAMAVLALIFVQGLRAARAVRSRGPIIGILVASAYYVVNDLVDYFGPDYNGSACGLRPVTVPCDPAREQVLALLTFGLTVFATFAVLSATRPPVGRRESTLDERS